MIGLVIVVLIIVVGIVLLIIENMIGVNLELFVIVIGVGVLMFLYVNDVGFWMVKEYLGLIVKEIFKIWMVLEMLFLFIVFGGVLLFDMFV